MFSDGASKKKPILQADFSDAIACTIAEEARDSSISGSIRHAKSQRVFNTSALWEI